MSQRPITTVPVLVLALLALGLAAQIGLKASGPPPRVAAEDLPPAPSIAALRLASFGDPVALAKALRRYAVADAVPLWAKQMEIFILGDMNERETARLIIGGYVQSGTVKDPAELRFLEERLKQLEARTAGKTSGKD